MQSSVPPLLMLAAALSFSAASIAEGFMPWTDVMKMADKNSDGMITPSEVMYFESSAHFVGFQPFMADHFKDFDADGDGMVSMDEASAGTDKLGMSDAATSKAFFERQGFMPRNAK
jgi:hypothetical protein